jgi:hypothetical protein
MCEYRYLHAYDTPVQFWESAPWKGVKNLFLKNAVRYIEQLYIFTSFTVQAVQWTDTQ